MDMKSISQKLQDDIRKIMEGSVDEALVGKQRNIDVNKNGKIDGEDFVKLRAMKKTPDGKVHNCATHVEHAVLGKGVTISEQHAEPDAEGKIEWYTVQFENSTQKVLTKDLTITMSESHEHKNKKNKMEEAANRAQQAAIAISLIKAGKKDGKMPKSMKEELESVAEGFNKMTPQQKAHEYNLDAAQREMDRRHAEGEDMTGAKIDKKNYQIIKPKKTNEETTKPTSPFDWKNKKSELPTKPGEKAGFDSKKISTGTVYSKKPVKEESHQSATTMKHIPNPSPALKKAAKDIKPGIAGYRDRIAMLKAGGVKEEAVQKNEEFSFSDYLVAAIHIVGEDHAVELANYAFNLQDTSIFENLETEAFNASNVNAQHAAGVKAHHDAELKKKADAGDENAKKRMELIKKSREAKTSEFNSRMDYM